MKKYYKVYKDFNNYISIGEDELEKALHAFMNKSALFVNEGAIGQVESVLPDYNRTMGWNSSYELNGVDYNEIRNKHLDKEFEDSIKKVKMKIQHLGKNENNILPEPSKEEIIEKQISQCTLCTEFKGYRTIIKNGERIITPCSCNILPENKLLK